MAREGGDKGAVVPELALLRLVDRFHTANSGLAGLFEKGFVDMARARCATGTKHAFGTRFVPEEMHASVTLQGDDVSGRLRRALAENSNGGDEGVIEDGGRGLRNRRGKVGSRVPLETRQDKEGRDHAAQNSAMIFGALTPRALKRSGETFGSAIETLIALANLKNEMRSILNKDRANQSD